MSDIPVCFSEREDDIMYYLVQARSELANEKGWTSQKQLIDAIKASSDIYYKLQNEYADKFGGNYYVSEE